MRIKVSGIELNARLERIKSVFAKSKNNNFGQFLKVVVHVDKLELQAMNDRIALRDEIYGVSTDLGDNEVFSFLLDAKTFIQFVEGHKTDLDIVLMDNKEIKISYKRGSFSFTYEPNGSYPTFFEPSGFPDFVIKSSYFVPAIKKSFLFVGHNEFRPEIETIFLDVLGDCVNIVSTDLQRIFISKKVINDECVHKNLMLSDNAASILYDSLSDSDEIIKVYSDNVRTFLSFDTITLSDINIDRKFVNYKSVTDLFVAESKVVIEKDSFVKALTAMSLVESMLCIHTEKDKMVIESEEKSVRKKVTESIDVRFIEGSDFDFNIVSKNILPSVKVLSGKEITLEYSAARRAIKMFGTNGNEYILNTTFATY